MQDIANTVYSGFQSAYQTISDIGVKNFLLLASAATTASVASSYVAEVIEGNRYRKRLLAALLQDIGPERISDYLSQQKEFYVRMGELVKEFKSNLDRIVLTSHH